MGRRSEGVPVWVVAVAAGVGTLTALAVVGGFVAYRLMQPGQQAVAQGIDAAAVTVAGPSADKEGVSWNHRELLDYLNTRGLSLTMRPTADGTSAFFGRHDADFETALDLHERRRECYLPGMVLVDRMNKPQHAHDNAGRSDVPAFDWGRWLFQSKDRAMLDRVRVALGG